MPDVLGIISAVIGTSGLLGNFVVCVVIWRIPHMHTVTNACLFNQAVADFFGSLIFMLVFNIPTLEVLPKGAWGWLYCYLWESESVMWMFLFTSAMSLVLVTLERYLAIVYPFKYRSLFARRWVPAVGIAATWLVGISMGLCIFALIDFSERDNKCKVALPTPTGHRLNNLVQASNVVTFFIPAWTMLFAYIHMAVVLKRGARQTEPVSVRTVVMTHIRSDRARSPESSSGEHIPETQGDSLLRARRNVIKALVLVCLAYFICWLPNTVMLAAHIPGLPYSIATVLAATNSCLNPVIYTIKYSSFRKGLKLLICGKTSTTVHNDHE
ncbi:somatostatin receptor type 5-like [Patiria miniata]|uniref:G-protein coupled receptors family 1 profile domain-containing protein n=1 Tax=Patiria miniata TaxID=46514 RepID=A0A914AW99_PATMI|nr:somatostatin receptor type 5-like [Patiria miniata]